MVYVQMGFIWDTLEPEDAIEKLPEEIKFLFMHGTDDSVVDLEHSQRLFDVGAPPNSGFIHY